MKPVEIKDVTQISNYKEIDKVELSTITKNEGDKEVLSGLVISGYETKFSSKPNENREVYEKGAITSFIQKYFVDNKLNIPVTILHRDDIHHLAGRVLVVETNGVGFYFVVYIPKTYKYYNEVLGLIKEGILQGFSKEGYAIDYEYRYTPTGEYDYMLIKEMAFYVLSIVATPANNIAFDRVAVTKIDNSTKLIDNQKKPATIEDELFG